MTVAELPSLDDDTMGTLPLEGMPAPVAAAEDPAAPYGRTVDGQPKRKPGRPRKPRANAAGPKPPAPPRPKPAAKPAQGKGPDYAAAVAGPLQLIGFGVLAAGQRTGNLALVADSLAIAEHTPPIAAAVGDLANQNPQVAALLDKLANVGPYGALIGAVFPLIAQVGVNHGAVPAGMVTALAPLGIKDAVTLLTDAGYTVLPPQPAPDAD